MSKIIKNLRTDESRNYAGMSIAAESQYLIPSDELLSFQGSDKLLNDLTNPAQETVMEDSAAPGQNIVGAAAINFLLDSGPKHVMIDEQPAFSAKVTTDGKKLFRRKHGVCKTILAGQSDTLAIVVPYNEAKINTIEIVNCKAGDTADLKVYDTPTGTISTVPNYMLNQFGFGVCLPDGFYKDESKYDADVIKDMTIELTYNNNGADDLMVGINVTLHELV